MAGYSQHTFQTTINFSYIPLILSFIFAYIFPKPAYIRFTLRFNKLAIAICFVAFLGMLTFEIFYNDWQLADATLVIQESSVFILIAKFSWSETVGNEVFAIINFLLQDHFLKSRLFQTKIQKRNKITNDVSRKLIFLFLSILYALGVYFHATTASQSNTYFLGIETLHSLIYPCAILVGSFIFSCTFSNHANINFTLQLNKVAIIICLIILGQQMKFNYHFNFSCSYSHWTLSENLIKAFLCPRFSLASLVTTLLSLIFAILSFLVVKNRM